MSFEKIVRVLGYSADITVEDGVKELSEAILSGFLFDPHSQRSRNAQNPLRVPKQAESGGNSNGDEIA